MKFSIDEEQYEIIFSPGEDASDEQLWDYDQVIQKISSL